LSSEGWVTSWWFEPRPDDPDEVLAIVTLGTQTFLLPARKQDRSSELDAIKAILDKHRTVLIDAVRSGDSSLLGEVYLDPSSVSDSDNVYEVLDSEIVAYVFLSDPTAVVATSESRQQWHFEGRESEALTKQGDPKEVIGCYRLERKQGVWRIVTAGVPAWTATPIEDCIP
jgi:hypothetical protein